MKRFVEGEDRRQSYLLPESLDDYVSEDNPVRVVEVFIDELDLGVLGFAGVEPASTGRPAYHPSTMLKLYLYGYLNRVQSSRRLEREAGRNIELIWLTGRLAPDFKTIANFRRDNGAAIREACAQFVVLCRRMNLFSKAIVAIDGSKFKAVNNRDKNFTVAKVAKRLQQVDASIARYLAALDRADREESDVAEARTGRIQDKIAGLRRQMQALKAMAQQVEAAPDKQVSLTDPDARSMATSGRGTGVVGYNVQTAVDAEHHLIVAHEVTNVGHDRTQLQPMAVKARAEIGCEELTALADRGYFNGEQVLACEGTGVLPCIPKTVWPGEDGFFTRQDFVYDAENDHYTCPAGQTLTRGLARSDRKDDIDIYRHLTACFTCPLKPRCTPDKLKRLKRWQHEDVLDKMQARLDRMPDAMLVRRQTVEHPFGTLKAWMGSTHFLTRTLEKVRTEMKRRMEQVEASIERYMAALETADRQEGELAQAKGVRLRDKIAALREQMKDFQALEKAVHAAPDKQISLTDPDARAMATSGKGTGMVGYNVQTAVDTEHHLIVAHEVTNVGHDRGQLANMAGQAKEAMGAPALEVLADRGYFSGEEVLACEPLGVTPYVPKPLTSGAKAVGRFGKPDFIYNTSDNTYRCPAGETLTWRFTSVEKGMTMSTYWTTRCDRCPLRSRCTSSKQPRWIRRWEHEAVIDAMQERLDRKPDAMRIRRATAEHPFGALKACMGATHFKMKTLDKVKTEMSLHVLAYNLKRMIAILGPQPLMQAMRA